MKAKLIVFLIHIFAVLPMSLLEKLGRFIGYIYWLKSARLVEITRINLSLCFPLMPEMERENLAKNSLEETMITIAQAGAIWLNPVKIILQHVEEVEGLELFKTAHAEGKGVIMISPHLGNWELLGLYVGACGIDQISYLYQPIKDKNLDKLIIRARTRGNSKVEATSPKGVASLLSALRRGELVGILPDQVPTQAGGEYASFFGVDAYTMTLISRLLKKTGARAVFASAYRVKGAKGSKFKIIFQNAPAEIYAEHMQDTLLALNSGIESLVNIAPEQYQWEYKRFKKQANGSKLY